MKKPEKAEAKAQALSQEETQPPSFEAAQSRLEEIVSKLEEGDLPLEQSLALFEEGVRLSRAAQQQLDQAEKRVEELLGLDASGKPITREFAG